MMAYIKFAVFLLVAVLTQKVLGSSFDVSAGEFSNRFCSKCQPEACPEIPEKCPVGLVTDLCGCCTQGVCGVVEGEKCYNVSLEPTLPAENKKYGLCGNNLHCLLRPDLSFRVCSTLRVLRVVAMGGGRGEEEEGHETPLHPPRRTLSKGPVGPGE
uniref:IGFBP N-terminal domain-containing protein n=1 Tax=Timema tahoe TaxID=61484 RepID=A0A7R9FHJ6_9NEOP|nr:unnamed protein product [Timema tahoe]